MQINALSQRDSRWANINLGHTTDTTLGSHGCTITDIAMFAGITPDEVNERLKKVKDGFVQGNLVYWIKLKEAMPWIDFEYKHHTFDNVVALEAIKNHGACLVEVDFDGTPRTDDHHWVLFTGDKKMNDPWTGKIEPTSKYSILYSIVILKRTDGKRAGDKPDINTSSSECLLSNTDEGRKTFEKLVSNSTKADKTVQCLELGENADNITYETIEKSLAARDGALKSAKSNLAVAEQEIKNRVEQVGRLEEKLHI